MNFKIEALTNTLVAFFVLFSAMFDPRLSAVLAVLLLIALAFYKLYGTKSVKS